MRRMMGAVLIAAALILVLWPILGIALGADNDAFGVLTSAAAASDPFAALALLIARTIPPTWIGAAVVAILVAKVIVAATPTPPPDTAWGRVYRVLEWMALLFGRMKDGAGAQR